jgi:hypothetical protein
MARCARKSCRRWRPDVLVRRLGKGLLVGPAWFCSPDCVAAETLARLRRLPAPSPAPEPLVVPPLRLGVLLLHQGAITPSQLSVALRAQQASGRRLGEEAVRLGLCAPEAILKGLAAQAGVSYLTAVRPARMGAAPALSADEVCALGLVPIGAVESKHLLMVACAAPVPRAALSAVVQLTGWTAEPYLVSDSDLETLMTAYGASVPGPRLATHFVTARDADDAARRIAAAVADEHNVSMTEAHCAPFTWVRVAGTRTVSTLRVPDEQEVTCLVATTSR